MAVPQPKGVAYLPTPCAASTEFAAGAPVCFDTAGRAATPANTSGFVYAGTAGQHVDNSAGAAGAVNVPIYPPTDTHNRFLTLTLSGAALADNGQEVYFTGATTVSKTAGNGVKAGTVVALLATDTVLVDTMRHSE